MKLWLDGAIQSDQEARIKPQDRGLLLGDGLFETIRVADGAATCLVGHLARLQAGAAVLGIPIPMDAAPLGSAVRSVIAANALSQGSLRLTLTRGPGPRGVLPPAAVSPTLMITASDMPAALGDASVITATVTRRNEFSPLSRIKSLNYLDSILARREAAARGVDDAILLNTRGAVAETSYSNLLVMIGGRLLTPPVDDGALGGIARSRLIDGGMVREASLTPGDLLSAEGIFLCNSLSIRAVVRLDDRPVAGKPECLRLMRNMLQAVVVLHGRDQIMGS